MIVVRDTNVLYAALRSSQGASHEILRLVLDEKITLALSNSLYFEYADVLARQKTLAELGLRRADVHAVLDAVVALAMKKQVYFRLRPNLTDEADNLVVECAWTGNADFLVTHNTRDFAQSELRGFRFEVVTPKGFLTNWRASQ